ncbi:MAG: DUF378 domain-containing protein, partial [Planctomycetes bacterium]|nr:DUF378 domain-containing protein [Planctomycetota bacterium]
GGLNWGLVALFDWDLVAAIFGAIPVLASIIYLLVAISAIYVAFRMPYLSHLHDRYPAERHGAHPVS